MAMQQEPIDWRYRFHIFLADFLGLNFQGISPENMAKHMVLTYLRFRILKFPLNLDDFSIQLGMS